MLQMYFAFFNVESIHGFISTFVAICSDTSYPFGLLSRSKSPTLDTLKFIVTKLVNQDKKFPFTRVDEDGAPARYSEFMKTCHNMNIIVQTAGGDAYYLNGKNESPNKKLSNILRSLLLNSIHKKELWCLTCSSPRRLLFLHALSFECTTKLCIIFSTNFQFIFTFK